VSRLVVVLVWAGLALFVMAGVTGHLPAATGTATGSGWDALPPLVQAIVVVFPAGLLVVLVPHAVGVAAGGRFILRLRRLRRKGDPGACPADRRG
jgi:hypothetical protein